MADVETLLLLPGPWAGSHFSPWEHRAINFPAPHIWTEAGLRLLSFETFHFISDALSHSRVWEIRPSSLSLALNTAKTNCCAGPWRGVSFHPRKRLWLKLGVTRLGSQCFPRQPVAWGEPEGEAVGEFWGGIRDALWCHSANPRILDSQSLGKGSQHLIMSLSQIWSKSWVENFNLTVFRSHLATSCVTSHSMSLSFLSLKCGQSQKPSLRSLWRWMEIRQREILSIRPGTQMFKADHYWSLSGNVCIKSMLLSCLVSEANSILPNLFITLAFAPVEKQPLHQRDPCGLAMAFCFLGSLEGDIKYPWSNVQMTKAGFLMGNGPRSPKGLSDWKLYWIL